ncbi:MAG: hypothetical protein AVDCRST_MAG79-719 [uncultured Thermoleophilia bacterium]|uniref:Uncharacterized protein n=1 Tax=uncultured Thermoleophilia bacterium TaxID=1497501 RepID=A0A6J4TPK0_9ACTN|nr:MAG: hypothetical protein AVDCRST_MAG79-719 [uncultured Thermoleophilia bacterium]
MSQPARAVTTKGAAPTSVIPSPPSTSPSVRLVVWIAATMPP